MTPDPGRATSHSVELVLPTVEELCEAMAATGDIPPTSDWGGSTVTRTANGFPRFARAVLDLLEAKARD